MNNILVVGNGRLAKYIKEQAKTFKIPIDVSIVSSNGGTVKHEHFDSIIYTTNITNIDYIEQHYIDSMYTNIVPLIEWLKFPGKFVYVSSTEALNIDGIAKKKNKYGLQKCAAEMLVKNHPNYSIVRTDHVYSPDKMYGYDKAANDNYVIPTYIRDLAKALICVALDIDVRGRPLNKEHFKGAYPSNKISYVLGPERMTRHEMALKTNRWSKECSMKDFKLPAPRDGTGVAKLQVSKRFQKLLGLKPKIIEQAILEMIEKKEIKK